MGETPIATLSRLWVTRNDRLRPCAYGRLPLHSGIRCDEQITLRASEAAGHRGFCSHDHAALDEEERVI